MGNLTNIKPFKDVFVSAESGQISSDFQKYLDILWQALTGNLTGVGLINGIGQATLATPQATTSGTAIDFTAIPSWVTEISLQILGLSTNGTADIVVRLGSGGIESTGYLGASVEITDATATIGSTFTTAMGLVDDNSSASIHHGRFVATLLNSSTNTWAANWVIANSNGATIHSGASSKSLAGVLTEIRLATGNGTDTFDAGIINIRYS